MDSDKELFEAMKKRMDSDKKKEEYFYSVNDEVLGVINIALDGKIVCKNIKIDGKKYKYNHKIPVTFNGIKDFDIMDFNSIKNNFNINNYISSIKKFLNKKEDILKKIVMSVIEFYESDDYENVIEISISSNVHFADNSIYISVSFAIYEEKDEIDAYIDLQFDLESEKIKTLTKGFY